MKFVVDRFGAWKSSDCSLYEVLDGSLVTFNCTRLAGYAILLVCSCSHVSMIMVEFLAMTGDIYFGTSLSAKTYDGYIPH